MALIDVEGRQVEYVLEGSGELVVFSSPSWWPLDPWLLSGFPQLHGSHRLLAFNHRGIGASQATSGPYSVPSLANDALALLDALNVPQPVHIIGFAIGSPIALEVARTQPERIRSLVLAAAGAGAPANAPSAAERDRGHIQHMGYREFIRHHALNDEFAFSPANYARYPERAAALADALWDHQGPEEEFLKHAAARNGHMTLDGASGVRQPCLVLVGEDDDVARGISTPVRFSRELAAALPNAKLKLLPGIRHMTFWEEPESAWAAVKEFLASI